MQNWFVLVRARYDYHPGRSFQKWNLFLAFFSSITTIDSIKVYLYYTVQSKLLYILSRKNAWDRLCSGKKTEALFYMLFLLFKTPEKPFWKGSTYKFWMQHFWGFLHKAAWHSRGWYSVVSSSSLNSEKAPSKPPIYRGFFWCFN